jgi:hypothetical protein
VPENPPIYVRLELGGTATWRPIAKDGAELPAGHRELCPAQLTIAVGETYDFEFGPEQFGELALKVVRPFKSISGGNYAFSQDCRAASRE